MFVVTQIRKLRHTGTRTVHQWIVETDSADKALSIVETSYPKLMTEGFELFGSPDQLEVNLIPSDVIKISSDSFIEIP